MICLQESENDHQRAGLEMSFLRSICNDISYEQVERYRILKCIIQSLPPGVRDAHEDEILGRRVWEQFDSLSLKQVCSSLSLNIMFLESKSIDITSKSKA